MRHGDIADDEVNRARGDRFDSFAGGRRQDHLVTIQFERVLTEIADALFVVHHQHNWLLAFRHVSPLKMGHILDRKSTRLNSSHDQISYAVFCLKKTKTS